MPHLSDDINVINIERYVEVIFFIETDEQDFNEYRCNRNGSCELLMGESWESVHTDKFSNLIKERFPEELEVILVAHEYQPDEHCAGIQCAEYNDGSFSKKCDQCKEFSYYQWLKKDGYRLVKPA